MTYSIQSRPELRTRAQHILQGGEAAAGVHPPEHLPLQPIDTEASQMIPRLPLGNYVNVKPEAGIQA